MRGSELRLLLSCLLIPLSVSGAAAADTGYFSVKGGVFLPNGNSGATSLKSFDNGYNAELAVGFRPESYAALELGTGLYSATSTVSTADSRLRKTVYGIPITATAKAILDLKRSEFFAGAGVGYYFAFIDNHVDFLTGGLPSVQESSHGGALGYHVVLGGDYKVTNRFRVGADFKWFAAKPELELTDAQNVKSRAKWDVGGEVLNVGIKYLF
jgi:outer membrane protein W